MRTRLILCAVLVASIGLPIGSAAARDQGAMGTASPDKRHLEKEFPPIPGLYPVRAGAHPFAGFRPPACRAANYCDSVEIEVDFSDEYQRENIYGVSITLEWENPYDAEKNPTGNDVDMFLWGDDGEAAGGPASQCGSPTVPECNNIMPEIVTVTEPERTAHDDALALFLTIVNHEGVNIGYKISVDWFEIELEAPPAFVPPERETSAQDRPQVAGPFSDFDVTGPRTADDEDDPEATPRTILVPGPDGKLHEVDLPVYAAGQRLEGTAEENRLNPFIPAAIVGVVALGALTWYLRVRSRRRADY